MNEQRSGIHLRGEMGFLSRPVLVGLALALALLLLSAAQAAGWQSFQPADAPAAPAATTVRGVVFNDLNGNGRQDASEPGLPGVKVRVYWVCGTGGIVFTDVFTDLNGFYSYTSPCCIVRVVETNPSGYFSTTPDDVPLWMCGGVIEVNFGDQGVGIVSGLVFNDLNGNGRFDAGEVGIPSVTVRLLRGSTVVQTAVTDANGNYRFLNVQPGAYTVVETDLAGYFSTTPNDVGICVAVGGAATASFGDQQVGTVSGVVFDDRDGNGVQNSGEPGIQGVAVRLTDGVDVTITTDANGVYRFANVRPDPYAVAETDPAGYVSTTPNECRVTVAAGGSASCNFGDQRAGQVSGIVFSDLNGNGVRDATEFGIDGVQVTLSDGSRRTTYTAGGGLYSFTGVAPGAYTVIETDLAYYFSTTPNSRAISVPSGGSASASFGDQPAGIVSGVVFDDLNGNGRQDAGEAGIGGVTVQLVNDDMVTTITAGNGAFIFVGVEPGPYNVIETDPAGFVSTTPNSRAVTVPAGGSATANFGDQPAGIVSGVVFDDLNGNGRQDAGEAGIGGVTVELTCGGTTRTTTAAGNGVYVFSDVAAGACAAHEINPEGWASVTPDVVNVSAPPGGSATANFADWPVGVVQGAAFNDLDGDGAQSAGEPGMAGVVMALRQDGALVASTLTGGDGSYSFANVAPGRYQVCAEAPAGFTPTASACRDVVVPAAGSATASFGFQLAGTVAGVAFNDRDGNGRRDPGEAGLGGVIVKLRRGATVVASDTTTGDGGYAFANVAAGPYQVCAIAPAGFVATGPLCQDVLLPAGGSAAASFGFREMNSVQGVVFNDFNSNGRLDAGEAGLGGVTVQLYDMLGNVMTTLTSGDGGYRFAGVAPGSYGVVEQNPASFISVSPDWVFVSLVAGGSAGANFGDQRAGVVSGVVFNDLNGNGSQDAGEPGIGGVTVTLAGAITRTTTTAGNGGYLFGGVIPGNYTVSESDPAGYFSTTPNSVGLFVFPGGGGGAVFGDQAVGTVAGTVFDDLDGDGVRDAGEAGLAGVTVELRQSASVVMRTITAADGAYRFAPVLAGAYTVVETDPAGYFSTTPNERPVLLALGGAATADFGDRRGGTVSGVVFDDLNGDGRQSPGEPGIGGVTMALSNGATRTTDANGVYRFDGVSPGTYTVSETDLPGYVSTTPNAVLVAVAAGGGATASFGDRRTGSVSGIVFDDVNGNGSRDAGERGIGGVTVALNNGAPRTTTTAGDGSYRFDSVPPGAYTVVENDPPGCVSTTPNSRSVFIASGGSASVNFGDQRAGTVGGVVFFDLDGDGVYDPGEAGFGMVQVQLIGETTRSVFTTGLGAYLFSDVAPGSYTVCVVPLPGLVNTTLNCQLVSVADGGSASANFGFQWGGTIGGVVFNDSNGNGVQDAAEPGIGGVPIRLINPNGANLGTTTTAGSGAYSFGGLTTGRYTVVESDPAGFASSTPNTLLVPVEGGGSGSANFGDFQAGAVVGAVFNDLNGNGRRNCGCGGAEDGIGGVTVTLFRNGVQIRQTTTNGDGSYAFPDLVAGTYVVRETDPVGFVSSTPNEVTVLVPAGGSAGASFGDYAAGCIYGTVFHDVNGNGVRESSEVGLAGVLVTLKNAGGAILQTVRTDGNGNYAFCGLAQGTYIVEEADPAGYGSTTPNLVTVSLAPSVSRRVDFGDAKLGSICGRKTLNPGARPVGGVIIELWNSTKTTLLATTTTASNGTYCFRNLPPGTYWLHEVVPGGAPWRIWTPWQSVALRSGSSATVNFVNGYDPCVLGEVYNDLNLDGERGEDEPALSGVHMLLMTDAGVVISDTITAGDGSYDFMDVNQGAYLVAVMPPDGWGAVTENPVAIALADPEQGETIYFGLATFGAGGAARAAADVPPTGALHGQAREANGQGIPGVVIVVRDGQGNVIGQATTIGDGSYQVAALPAGALTVVENDLPGYVSLTPNVRTVYLAPGGNAAAVFVDTPRDAGISGSVFRDDDGDGQRAPDEGGIGGVAVQLKQNGQVVQTYYTTTVSGAYVFSLVEGVYEVAAANAEDHVSTTSDVVRGFGPAVIDFGDRFAGAPALIAQAGRAVVAGRVYNDADANGASIAGERLLGGVIVSLRTLDGTEVMTATTTGNGEYAFLDLPSGAYEVAVAAAPGFVATTASRLTVWAGPDGTAAADFGRRFVAPGHGAVAGRVFDDLNGDGRLDPNEPPLVGVAVSLARSDGAVVAETTTAGDGSYLFDVAAGNYRLALPLPSGFAPTTRSELTLAVAEGQLSSVQFGLLAVNTVSGAVFFDADGDGVRSAEERGMGGITLDLWAADGALVGQPVASADGYYLLGGLPSGVYTVSLTLPAGLAATTPVVQKIVLTGRRGDAASFGVQFVGTVGGGVFQDANGNDRLDAGETGISGVLITVSRPGMSRTVATTSDGAYQFFDLPAGDYVVTETDPTGFTSTRNVIPVTVLAGGSAAVDFGDRPVRTISGCVFHDLKPDGVMGDGEPGFGGVLVQLRPVGGGTVIAEARTRGNGGFEFRDVAAGSYKVGAAAPTGFLFTALQEVAVTLAADDSKAANFGLRPRGQLLYLPVVLKR